MSLIPSLQKFWLSGGKKCNSMDHNLPGSSVHRIILARILEWVAVFSSRNLPNPGMEPGSPPLAGEFFTTESPGKPLFA